MSAVVCLSPLFCKLEQRRNVRAVQGVRLEIDCVLHAQVQILLPSFFPLFSPLIARFPPFFDRNGLAKLIEPLSRLPYSPRATGTQ